MTTDDSPLGVGLSGQIRVSAGADREPDAVRISLVLGGAADGLQGEDAEIRRIASANGFDGETGQVLAIPSGDGGPYRLLAGCRTVEADALRSCGLSVGRRAETLGPRALDARGVAGLDAAAIAAFVEGVVLGSFKFAPGAVLDPPAPPRLRIGVESGSEAEVRVACERAEVVAAGANLSRALVETPPSELTPARFGELVGELGARNGWSVKLRGPDELLAEGFGGIAAVGGGSENPPCLIEIDHRGRDGDGVDLCLVGKGITMDCGGLNLKTNRPQAARMKADMAGGAAVLAALLAATRLRLGVNLRVLIAAAENMPGPGAIRPGDVIRQQGGRRTEITNTDAEGRVVLADCLAAAAADPQVGAIVDVGTLTDAPLAPVGWLAVTTSTELGAALALAARRCGELGLPVPLVPGYEFRLRSAIADSTNFDYGRQEWDAMIAAAFLAPFAGSKPWAHIDVSGAAFLTEPWGTWPAGATGMPARSLLALAESWSAER